VRALAKVAREQFIRAFATARIDLRGDRVNPVAIGVKGAQETTLVEPHVGLNALEGVFSHEERAFHRAVMAPEPHGAPRRVKTSAAIGKAQRHGYDFI